MMFPDKINQILFLCAYDCFPFLRHRQQIFYFMKEILLAHKDKQIKKFTCQREFPLAMASGRVEFSGPDLSVLTYVVVLKRTVSLRRFF